MAKKVESYKLNVAPSLYDGLKRFADQKHTSVAELMRRGVKWVLLEERVSSLGGKILIWQDANAQYEIENEL